MRALDSRRPRPVDSSFLVYRPFVFLLLILHVLSCTEARSVPRDEDSQPKTSQVSRDDVQAVHRDAEIPSLSEDDGAAPKKRRRNDDPAFQGKLNQQDILIDEQEAQAPLIGEDQGIRRFDAQIDPDNAPDTIGNVDEGKNPIAEGALDLDKDNRKRLVDGVPSIVEETSEIDVKRAEVPAETHSIKIDRDKNEESVVATKTIAEPEEQKIANVQAEKKIQNGSPSDVEEEDSKEIIKEFKEDIKTLANEGSEIQGKGGLKSSAVYLNTEDEKIPEGVPEEIVDGQIKKLISIRDDAIDLVKKETKKPENLKEASALSAEKSLDVADEEKATEEGSDLRNERSNPKSDELPEDSSRFEKAFDLSKSILQSWRERAIMIQEQIKNRTFRENLQSTEILPEIPKFTENQILGALKSIVSSKRAEFVDKFYADDIDKSKLTDKQLEILKCAEQIVPVKQRQSFIQSMSQCFQGLSFMNCIRTYIWPMIVDNLPSNVANYAQVDLPIEINIFDYFTQGNKVQYARLNTVNPQSRLLTPESIIYSMLKTALELSLADNRLPTFIDSRNETLRKLLTPGQVEILQMGEKLLPSYVRREYSDRMFSCVRRFEYFSCVKYFAWPMVKQYFPALPAFPDYQSWYPSIPVIPEYPIVPFPSFPEESGQLPEVVDADGTRMKKPETYIVHILKNTLKDQRQPPIRAMPSKKGPFINFISPEQMMSIHMAEQLVPMQYRPEFVQRTVKCIQEYNYLTCIKYSTWPTIKQFNPSIPEIPDWSQFIPDWQLPNFSDYIPNFSDWVPEFPSFPDFSGYFPGGETTTTTPAPGTDTGSGSIPDSGSGSVEPTKSIDGPQSLAVLIRKSNASQNNVLEAKVTDILKRVRNNMRTANEGLSTIVGGNVVILTTVTEEQVNILRLAESILPPLNRATFIVQVVSCLHERNDFMNCTRYVIWPILNIYVPDLPDFPLPESEKPPIDSQEEISASTTARPVTEAVREQIVAEKLDHMKISSRTPFHDVLSRANLQQDNVPVISVTGTRFVPIYTDNPENVIFNIVKSIQQSSPNYQNQKPISNIRTPEFSNLFSEQQETIIRITEILLPESVRPNFVNRMIDCVRENDFMICSRDVLWPALSEYFPTLPGFPNFGIPPNIPDRNNTGSPSQNLTESSNTNTPPLSEIKVATGQHGDAVVTITDTRFVPIFTEHPEAVIFNILRTVQLSTQNLRGFGIAMPKRPMISNLLTDQQSSIILVAESLLPENVRTGYLEKMATCVTEYTFIECTRDITWPTVAQFFPRLPSFPHFGSMPNIPRIRYELPTQRNKPMFFFGPDGTILVKEVDKKATQRTAESIELELEDILKKNVIKNASPERSYLNMSNPIIADLISSRQASIIRLIESGLPDSIRAPYLKRFMSCIEHNDFIGCTQRVSWRILKQFNPGFPDFPNFGDYFSQLPQVPDFSGQFPTIPGIPQFPDTAGFGEIPQQFPGFPGFPAIPENIPQFGGALKDGQAHTPAQRVGEIPQIPVHAQADVPSHDPQSKTALHPDSQDKSSDTPIITPSVGDQGSVPGYPGQPSGIVIDISMEKIKPSEVDGQREVSKKRNKRDIVNLLAPYRDDNVVPQPISESSKQFPNFTESEFLQLLVNVSLMKNRTEKEPAVAKEYFVDTLNDTIRASLTADQYEILKLAESLNPQISNRGFLSRVVQCIRSLSFIRCMGIFIWPYISSNLPQIGFLSFRNIESPGRSTQPEVEKQLGMTTAEFETELLTRKKTIENSLVDWYKMMIEGKYHKDFGFLKVKGYGNGALGISLSSTRRGRASKIKDNKNLPSILTIISDIMEEVLDQRSESDKTRKDKDKRNRSIRTFQDPDYQFLHETDESASSDIERSINDDKIISMFLEKLKSNASEYHDSDGKKLTLEDAYKAFEELFGSRLNNKFANKLKTLSDGHLRFLIDKKEDLPKKIEIVPLEGKNHDRKVVPLESQITYDLAKEPSDEIEKRRDRTRNFIGTVLSKYSDKYLAETQVEKDEDGNNNNIVGEGEREEASERSESELILHFPKLNEEFMSRKTTNALLHLGRAMSNKMTQMMPGVGFIISFIIQMALAHARAAASMAGMLSNMALGSAMIGMIRQMMFGPSMHPKIKYVYDNDKTGPGIAWPAYSYPGHYYGK